ncbi:GxxExxY protein, partial [Bacteroides sp.]|uniref:GxxExxY protein n=1 Tax=Bacteroides sp. TaxID=29523 RepID=UPI002FC58753
VHTQLGAGLLESIYEACLFQELKEHGIIVERQKKLPIHYKEMILDDGYRIDLLVDNQLIIELKSVEQLLPIHAAQILTYMKLSKINYGLLLNFNVPSLKHGIKRFIV